MDQSLVHTFSWGNSYGPMVLKVLLKFPPTLVLVHGWLFPEFVRTFFGVVRQTVLPLSFQLSRKHAERVRANCLYKLFELGFWVWVVFWGGLVSLDKRHISKAFSCLEGFVCLARPSAENNLPRGPRDAANTIFRLSHDNF